MQGVDSVLRSQRQLLEAMVSLTAFKRDSYVLT